MVELSPAQRQELERLSRTPSVPNQLAQRARIVLRAAEGASNREIAAELGLSLPTVGQWRTAYAREGAPGLADRPRSGRPRRLDEQAAGLIVAKALEPPPPGTSHWSVRDLARELSLPPTTVHRVLRAKRVRPHQVRTCKHSTDPLLEEKISDIVGLYLDPPMNAFIVSVDEKTQIQALNRTQPLLPLRPGIPARQTHDYKRNGLTSLYAALEVATGKVIGECSPTHRGPDFLRFLQKVARSFPRRMLHVIVDNSSTHSTPAVKNWLEAHPRVQLHFTPKPHGSTSSSAGSPSSPASRFRRGTYDSVPQLISAIKRFIATHNEHAQPFVWTKSADHILAKAVRQETSGTQH